MSGLTDALYGAFHRPELRSHSVLHGVLWVLIAASIPLALWPLFSDAVPAWAEAIDAVLLGVFWVELILRIGTYRPPDTRFFDQGPAEALRSHLLGRLRFCITPLILIDIVTVVASFGALRGLRVFRLLRLLHGVGPFRYSSPLQGTARAFVENRLLFAGGLSLVGIAVLLGGASFYSFETAAPEPVVSSLADGLWWALVTLTTVGYGDIAPTTAGGRLVAGGLMVTGLFVLALFAGIVGQTLLSSVLSLRAEAFRMSNETAHFVVCGYDPGARMLLEALEREAGETARELVVFAPGERPRDVPPRFAWVTGDPTKESELDKARIAHADAVIVVGARDIPPQAADASTILTAFTIRRHLASKASTPKRKRPLYLVAEILERENVEHAKTAGADEVIETTRLGFSLLAHALLQPGAARILSRVATPEANNLYIGALPGGFELPMAFGPLADRLKRERGVLVMGTRSADGEDAINPEYDAPVAPGSRIIYLAEAPVLGA
jgi:voltage-gated potassium channel